MTFNDPDERILGAEGRNPSAQSSQYTSPSPSSSSDSNDLYNQYDPNDPMRPRPARAGWSPTRRFIIGSVIFVITAEALTYLIALANIKFNLHLDQPILGSQLNWFFVINVLVIVAVWVILKWLGFFPNVQRGTRRDDSRWREW